MQIERPLRIDVPGLGEKIRQARKADERSLTKLAALADMSVQNWYAIENEDIKVLPEATLRKIEAALGINFGIVFKEQESQES
ncbi:helix-turn-helix domain-containing protein [Nostoc sp. FACHB-145]|uniref:helix-turn-helix domain-containing protein n=1 Tax=Nostoc sp. FACHB-145 TaxID=2692836 RepID=UPI0016823D12|nr:helix-turn-helix transcriptional regulator [Nostoc sp. FACHB-145]MBD2471539.1 helix-turn-helix transcriptional regulator [Nostoc sp. FACHB-145]